MRNRRNYYRVLHVDRDAPAEVIHASYRTLMHRLRVHPDLGGDEAEAALVNEALATLSDPVRRAAYDRTLERSAAQRSRGTGQRTPDRAEPSPPSKSAKCSFCGAAYPGTRPPRPEATCATCKSPLCPAPRHDAGGSSRREMERLPRDLPVSFVRADSREATWHGSTKDISLKGMRLLTPIRLAVGERLLIENTFCSTVAVVKSVRRNPSFQGGAWECGVELLTMRLGQVQGRLVSILA